MTDSSQQHPELDIDPEWYKAPPPLVVPSPAQDFTGNIANRRLILRGRNPEHGDIQWISDVRAWTEAHPYQGPSGENRPRPGETVIGVLSEADYFRHNWAIANGEAPPVIVPWPVPIADAWVEELVDSFGEKQPVQRQDDVSARWRTPALVEATDKPPIRYPIPISRMQRVSGARVVISTRRGFDSGLRAVSEPFRVVETAGLNLSRGLDSLGEPYTGTMIQICDAAEYWRWQQMGITPDCMPWDTARVWVI